MLPRKKLIPLKSEFGRIRQTGKLYDSPSFGVVVTFGGPKTPAETQVAFVVSKKVSKSSVVRHAIKRKLSDSVASILPRLPKSMELVFLAKSSADKIKREELTKEMESLFKRAKLL